MMLLFMVICLKPCLYLNTQEHPLPEAERAVSRRAFEAGVAKWTKVLEADPSWLSVRFSRDGATFSRATQARWR